jgi:RIO kinase 2
VSQTWFRREVVDGADRVLRTFSYFMRDVNCIRKFFRKRFRYEAATWPRWRDVLANDDDGEEVTEIQAEQEQQDAEGAAGEGSRQEVPGVAGGKSERKAKAVEKNGRLRLDLEVEASGFGGALQQELEEVTWYSSGVRFS